jgi:Protein of unknown function (DUF3800)
MSPTSSPYFILAAVIVRDDWDASLRQLRDEICTDLGKPTTTVLHWAENVKEHAQRKHVAHKIATAASFARLSFVIVDKAVARAAGVTGLVDPTRMYNYTVRRLLERVSWLVDGKHREAILSFAQVRRFKYHRLDAYLAHLNASQTSIQWAAIRGKPRIEEQAKVQLLQVADLTAGALYSAITPDRFGNLEPVYLASLRPLIYERPPADVTSYGMNVVGDPAAMRARLPWWNQIWP